MSKKQKYYLTQKLVGVLTLLIAALSIIIIDGGVAVAIILAPIGFTYLLSKDMVLTNRYFFEVKKRNGEL